MQFGAPSITSYLAAPRERPSVTRQERPLCAKSL